MSDRPFTVRRATEKDAGELAHLAEVTYTETFGHLYPPEDLATYVASTYTAKACLETLSDPRMAYWLAGAEGEPAVGFTLCRLLQAAPVPGLAPTAGELRQLYVRSAHQNQRLGTPLFDALWNGSRRTIRRSTSACGPRTTARSALRRADS
jgi:ribosomal protein S18 acetylase RimI-like enzyme